MNVYNLTVRYIYACPKTTGAIKTLIFDGLRDLRGVEVIQTIGEFIVSKIIEKIGLVNDPEDLTTILDSQKELEYTVEVPDHIMGSEMCRISVKIQQFPETLKPYAYWKESGKTFDDFVSVGDAVDEAMVDYWIGVVPPLVMRSHYVQCGEASDIKEKGATYTTFKKNEAGIWIYHGNCYKGDYVNVP